MGSRRTRLIGFAADQVLLWLCKVRSLTTTLGISPSLLALTKLITSENVELLHHHSKLTLRGFRLRILMCKFSPQRMLLHKTEIGLFYLPRSSLGHQPALPPTMAKDDKHAKQCANSTPVWRRSSEQGQLFLDLKLEKNLFHCALRLGQLLITISLHYLSSSIHLLHLPRFNPEPNSPFN